MYIWQRKYYDDLYFSANRPRPTEYSEPANIRKIGGQKQRPKGNYSGLCCVTTHFYLSYRKASAVDVDKMGKDNGVLSLCT